MPRQSLELIAELISLLRTHHQGSLGVQVCVRACVRAPWTSLRESILGRPMAGGGRSRQKDSSVATAQTETIAGSRFGAN